MHPAYSVIFFTTASGAGYGLLALLGLFAAGGVLPADRGLGLVALIVSLGLISGGLLSSTFHLGRPERAWRAVTQWRTSWLAREGVMAILTYVPAGLFAIGWVFLEETQGYWAFFGVLAALMAIVTVFCTSMIYRSLKTIHQWYNEWTIPAYLSLGLMTGSALLVAVTHLFGVQSKWTDGLALLAVPLAWAIKTGYWGFIRKSKSIATPETATGLKGGTVRVVELPHTEPNYLNKEMGFKVARKHADKLRGLSHLLGFAVPLALLLVTYLLGGGMLAGLSAVAAVGAMAVGVVTERWLFFAEAKHVVNLFYGEQTV